mgnify:CR=1 FL=1
MTEFPIHLHSNRVNHRYAYGVPLFLNTESFLTYLSVCFFFGFIPLQTLPPLILSIVYGI